MKRVQVIWSTEALVDLEIIYDFLSEQSVSSAQQIVEKHSQPVTQIETFPDSGATQESLKSKHKNYRYLIEGNYKIIYSYERTNSIAYVETIFDTRNDPEKLRT